MNICIIKNAGGIYIVFYLPITSFFYDKCIKLLD
jgi:hypothetical protein